MMLNLFKSKLFKAYRVLSPEDCLLAGLTENFLRLLSGTLSPPKSQRQNLQKAHVNVKYGCSDAHESPARLGELARWGRTARRTNEQVERQISRRIIWSHVLPNPVRLFVESSAIIEMARVVILIIIQRQRYKNTFNRQKTVLMINAMVLQAHKAWVERKIPLAARVNLSTLKGGLFISLLQGSNKWASRFFTDHLSWRESVLHHASPATTSTVLNCIKNKKTLDLKHESSQVKVLHLRKKSSCRPRSPTGENRCSKVSA